MAGQLPRLRQVFYGAGRRGVQGHQAAHMLARLHLRMSSPCTGWRGIKGTLPWHGAPEGCAACLAGLACSLTQHTLRVTCVPTASLARHTLWAAPSMPCALWGGAHLASQHEGVHRDVRRRHAVRERRAEAHKTLQRERLVEVVHDGVLHAPAGLSCGSRLFGIITTPSAPSASAGPVCALRSAQPPQRRRCTCLPPNRPCEPCNTR